MTQKPVIVSPASRGFTIIELLITLVLAGVLLGLGIPFVLGVIPRSGLEGTSDQVASLMRRARMQAIQLNRPALVVMDGDEVVGFVDNSSPANNTLDAGDEVLTRISLPETAQPQAPAGQGNAVTFSSVDGPIFLGDGSAVEEGAIRFGDTRGNYLQVQVSPRATGRVEVRKWQSGGWYLPGENGPWKWQ